MLLKDHPLIRCSYGHTSSRSAAARQGFPAQHVFFRRFTCRGETKSPEELCQDLQDAKTPRHGGGPQLERSGPQVAEAPSRGALIQDKFPKEQSAQVASWHRFAVQAREGMLNNWAPQTSQVLLSVPRHAFIG